MRKSYIIIVLCCLMGSQIKAQIPSPIPQIVHDPSNLAETTKTTIELMNLGRTMDKLKEINEKVEEIKKEVDWLRNAASVIELIRLIETTTCIIQDLDINMSIALNMGITNSCIDGFQYQINVRKLLLCIDQINSVLTKGTRMEPAERWLIVSTVLENFSESQLNFASLNRRLKREIFQARYQEAKKDIEQESKEAVVNDLYKHYDK